MYAFGVWGGYAVEGHINTLQIYQNKDLIITTRLPRITAIEILHEQR
jgi:hypothetical protein